jgi:DNA-binding winged helix-turn-helix (wHTH) protein
MTEMKPWPKVKFVRGPDGRPLSLSDLPLANMNRWVIRRKAMVVAAVRGGLVSMEQAYERYSLTGDEFVSWERACARSSMPAVHALAPPYPAEDFGTAIESIAPRANGHSHDVVTTGRLTVRLDAQAVDVDGIFVRLTAKEYQMLELLALRKGDTLTKDMFLNHLYAGTEKPKPKIIDVFICKLRKKLAVVGNGDDFIDTVWGRGYVLRDEHSP